MIDKRKIQKNIMHTYIQIYKNKSKYSKLFLGLCLGFILFGMIGLLISFTTRKSLIPLLNDAAYYSLIFNGGISFWLVCDSMKKAKYFVAWNDSTISYLLPKTDQTEIIQIENIKSVDIKRSEIIIKLITNETKNFNLNYFFFPERTTIISFFKKIESQV